MLCAFGKGVFLFGSYNYYGNYAFGDISGFVLFASVVLNGAFDAPALIYIASRITGNPDQKRLFRSVFLIFPLAVFAIPFIYIILSFSGNRDSLFSI